jgi:AcrR family transcriptional regulator
MPLHQSTVRKAQPPIDDRLLDTAIDQFGRQGLEGVSTRALAAAAGTAMSSITYHYGSKQGLYLAAARRIAEQIGQRFAAALKDAPQPQLLTAAQAVEQVVVVLEALVTMMLSPEGVAWSRFIVREQMDPTQAFDILWKDTFERLGGRLVELVRRAGDGHWKIAEARMRATALIGQVLVFRVARAAVMRVTGWSGIGAAEVADIRRVLRAHVRAILGAPKACL